MGACASNPASNVKEDGAGTAKRTGTGNNGHHLIEKTIRDRFKTIEEVQKALRDAGLESSELALAIDLTKSNEWSGNKSFSGGFQSMHTHALTGTRRRQRLHARSLLHQPGMPTHRQEQTKRRHDLPTTLPQPITAQHVHAFPNCVQSLPHATSKCVR